MLSLKTDFFVNNFGIAFVSPFFYASDNWGLREGLLDDTIACRILTSDLKLSFV